jgi:endoglucanase
LEVLDKIISYAASRGIVIMLNIHSLSSSNSADPLWYNSAMPESTLLAGWAALIQRYKSAWNVFAADLKNEPFEATWGSGDSMTDWQLAATRIGNYIVARVPWLIFVQGTGDNPSCGTDGCFRGENLQGVSTRPIVLNVHNKVVYSPHVFGPADAAANGPKQAYMSDPNFPFNLPAIWDRHFGFVHTDKGQTVVIGEWGGPVSAGVDSLWTLSLVSYLRARDMTDQFAWQLSPGDTTGASKRDNGLFTAGWKTLDPVRLTILSDIVPAPSNVLAMCVPGANAMSTSDASHSSSASHSRGLVWLLSLFGLVVGRHVL